MTRRLLPFIVIAAIGFAVQIAVMVLLQRAGVAYALSTIVAVECAVLHNFCWHRQWTWVDRGPGRLLTRLAAFHAANGATSLAGNLAIGHVLVAVTSLGLIARTTVAVLLTGALNLLLADRFVFRRQHADAEKRSRRMCTSRAAHAALIAAAAVLSPSAAMAAGPPAAAVAEWDRLIATTESSFAAAPQSIPRFDRQLVLAGGMDVHRVDSPGEPEGATIQRWRGAVLLPRVHLDAVLHSLTTTLPKQPDVTASRFISRSGDHVGVYLRLVRRVGITVTYDTDHDVRFRRLSPRLAASRSVMTRVQEVRDAGTADERLLPPGEDRGFLWRLNAYWWYEETTAGVIAVMDTLTLSRDIPMLVRPMAAPFVRRIGRESVTSALQGLLERAHWL